MAMVTSPHRRASEIGQDVLARGGNAIEAAVAMAAALSVLYPHFCGLGGDAVWMIADSDGSSRCLLGLGRAAAGASADEPTPTRGPRSTLLTAGAVDSWGEALTHSAAHWSGGEELQGLLAPAVGLALNGFPVSRSQAHWQAFRSSETRDWPGFDQQFGTAQNEGDWLVQRELAGTLGLIGRRGTRDFYEGQLAARIVDGLAAAGSPLALADLAATRSQLAAPLTLRVGDRTLLAPPPPTQGATTLAILGIMERAGISECRTGSAEFYHLAVEAVKQAFLLRDDIADPDFGSPSQPEWLASRRLEQMARAIDPDAALHWPHRFATADTVFFAASDRKGRMASVLQSTYYDWGSGVVVGDTGVIWHNRGCAFSTDPRSSNRQEPGKRPFYTLNPGIALRGGTPSLAYGTQGADGQPQTLAVVLAALLWGGMRPAEALAVPRFLLGKTFSDSRDTLKIEGNAGAAVVDALRRRGHITTEIDALSPLGGQAGLLSIDEDGSVDGAHDPRGDGWALPA